MGFICGTRSTVNQSELRSLSKFAASSLFPGIKLAVALVRHRAGAARVPKDC